MSAQREFAEYYGYKENKYDALLGNFEEGMTVKKLDIIFEELKEGILNILEYIKSSDIQVKDLPKIWNERYIEYLGVEPKTDNEGILQDMHWPAGSFGYFPSYALTI